MAFFEYLAALNDLLTSALGKFIKPVGGQGMNDLFPSPKAGLPPNPGMANAGILTQDSQGALLVRGTQVSKRYELRDDFTGASLNTTLTGTISVTNGSTTVTGSGTVFTTELNRDQFIKISAQTEAQWTRVRRVISDTSLELESGYLGATASAAAAQKTKWPTTTGSSGTFTVGTSTLTIGSGVTSGSNTFISRLIDFGWLHLELNNLSISQRLAAQQGYAGLFDTVASPTQQAAIIFDGALGNTQIKFRTSFTATSTDIQETTVTLPFGLTTNLTTINYVIDVDATQATLTINGFVAAVHTLHLPDAFQTFIAAVGINNTSTAGSNTNIIVNSLEVKSFDAPNLLPAQPEYHYVTGALTTTATTADQIIVSYTVPTGRTAYLLGFTVSEDGNVDGAPIKIGKNTVTTEPAAPGTTDANIFKMFKTDRASNGSTDTYSGDYSAYPRPFGFAADVLKITVTPSGTGSTVWRATLEILLKP